MWSIHTRECYSAIERNSILIHATTCMNFENILGHKKILVWFHLFEISRRGKFIQTQSSKEVTRGDVKERIRNYCFVFIEFLFRVMTRWGSREWGELHNIVIIIDATELYTQKWFKWPILCYIYFATIKKFSFQRCPGHKTEGGNRSQSHGQLTMSISNFSLQMPRLPEGGTGSPFSLISKPL